MFERGTPNPASFSAMASTALSNAGSWSSPAMSTAFHPAGCAIGTSFGAASDGASQAANEKPSASVNRIFFIAASMGGLARRQTGAGQVSTAAYNDEGQ